MLVEILPSSKTSLGDWKFQKRKLLELAKKRLLPARDERDQSKNLRGKFSAKFDEVAQNQTIYQVPFFFLLFFTVAQSRVQHANGVRIESCPEK